MATEFLSQKECNKLMIWGEMLYKKIATVTISIDINSFMQLS